jgi:hypothetical protein
VVKNWQESLDHVIAVAELLAEGIARLPPIYTARLT